MFEETQDYDFINLYRFACTLERRATCLPDIIWERDTKYVEAELQNLQGQSLINSQNADKVRTHLKAAMTIRETQPLRTPSPSAARQRKSAIPFPVHVEKAAIVRADNSPSISRFKAPAPSALMEQSGNISGARMQQLLVKQRDFAQDAIEREVDAHNQLTGELADLTQQLKGHSLQISDTLRLQNLQLGELKGHASMNLEALNMQRAQMKQRQKNMSMSLFTSIGVILTVIVVFAFTFLIIKVFPRANGWLM